MEVDIKTLQIIDEIFKKHNITYWLECGTLLGAVREGKLIEWDHDIDVSIFQHDLFNVYLLKSEFDKLGYKLAGFCKMTLYKNDKPLACIVPIKIKRGRLISLMAWHPVPALIAAYKKHIKANGCTVSATPFSTLPKPLYSNPIILPLFIFSIFVNSKKLEWGKFEWLDNFAYVKMDDGNYYPIPEHVEEYLEYRYRKDWRIPCKGVDWESKWGRICRPRWYCLKPLWKRLWR